MERAFPCPGVLGGARHAAAANRSRLRPPCREADEEGSDPAPPAPAHSSGPWQAVATLFNLYCGIGLLSMAYAVRLGGWLALLTLGAAAAASLCSGLLICKAFEHLPPGTHKTFPELGGAAGGRWGRHVATSAALAECWGGACIALLVMWEHLVLVMPEAGRCWRAGAAR